MRAGDQRDITGLLAAWNDGDADAMNRLMDLVYPKLRRIAHQYLARRRAGESLESGALTNEAYLKLVRAGGIRCQNRAHFLALCSQIMRRILVDHARRHRSAKRGGNVLRVALDDALLTARARGIELLALDEALDALARIDRRKSRVVELRYFGGLNIEETAGILGVSVDTVKRDWRMARAWLFAELGGKQGSPRVKGRPVSEGAKSRGGSGLASLSAREKNVRETARQFDIVIVGAGPAGIALAAEARAAGVAPEKILVLEKASEHSWIIRKYYPAAKPVLANYKGIVARCEGVLCIPDLTREETLTYLDRAIQDSGARVHYHEEVFRIGREPDGRLRVETSGGIYRAAVVVIAIGILGRPTKPSYPIPRGVKGKVFFDVTSEEIRDRDVIVVGGGDTATEYCQFLVQEDNRVTLSYRGAELTRPNPINRDSVLALERQGKLKILLRSNVASLEVAEERVRVRFEEQALELLEVDRVIYALGGTTPQNFLKSIGIEFDGPNPRLTDGFATSVPGLFLAGDLTAGARGGSIILAFNTAAAAMRQICEDHGICAIVRPPANGRA